MTDHTIKLINRQPQIDSTEWEDRQIMERLYHIVSLLVVLGVMTFLLLGILLLVVQLICPDVLNGTITTLNEYLNRS